MKLLQPWLRPYSGSFSIFVIQNHYFCSICGVGGVGWLLLMYFKLNFKRRLRLFKGNNHLSRKSGPYFETISHNLCTYFLSDVIYPSKRYTFQNRNRLIWIKIFIFYKYLQVCAKFYYTRKCSLCGYILGVLTHTAAWDGHWGSEETLKWVLICTPWLCLA